MKMIYSDRALTDRLSFGYLIQSFAEAESKKDGLSWMFRFAKLDHDNPNRCYATYDLVGDSYSEFTFLYEHSPKAGNGTYTILTKRHSGQK